MTAAASDDRALDRVLPPPHTCHRGSLCGAWPPDDFDDPISRAAGIYPPEPEYEGCQHGSCLTLVNEDCEGCQYDAWMVEADSRDELGPEARHLVRDHGWLPLPAGSSPSDVAAQHRIAHEQEPPTFAGHSPYRSPLVDHGRTPVHDMHHTFVGHVHEVSVPWLRPAHVDALLSAASYSYSHGWVDREGKYGEPGGRWMLYARTENTDGTLTRPIVF